MPDGAVVHFIRADARAVLGQPQRRSAVLRGGKNQVAVPVVDDARDGALVALEEDGAHPGARRLASGAAQAMTLKKGQRAVTLAELLLQSAAVVLRDVSGCSCVDSDEFMASLGRVASPVPMCVYGRVSH